MKYQIFITKCPKGITHFQIDRDYVNAFTGYLHF